jgi:hypothetical protein
MKLNEDVSGLIRNNRMGSAEWQLATFLLKRLQSRSRRLEPAVFVSNQSSHPGILFQNLWELGKLGKGAFAIVHKARWFGAEFAKKAFHGHEQGMANCERC